MGLYFPHGAGGFNHDDDDDDDDDDNDDKDDNHDHHDDDNSFRRLCFTSRAVSGSQWREGL